MTGPDHVQPWEKFIRDEQVALWEELDNAIDSAMNRAWSIRCAHLAHRIVRGARLVGPSNAGSIPWTLVAGRVYETICRIADLTPAGYPTNEAEWVRLDDLMARHGGTRATCEPRYADTITSILSPRETRFITKGDG